MKNISRYIVETSILFLVIIIPLSKGISQQIKNHAIDDSRAFIKSIRNAHVTIQDMVNEQFNFKDGSHRARGPILKSSDGSSVQLSDCVDTLVGQIILTKFGLDSVEYAVTTMLSMGGGCGHYFFIYSCLGTRMVARCTLIVNQSGIQVGAVSYTSMKVKGDTAFVYINDSPSVTNRFLFREDKLFNLDRK